VVLYTGNKFAEVLGAASFGNIATHPPCYTVTSVKTINQICQTTGMLKKKQEEK
jgi:hypothetical protein